MSKSLHADNVYWAAERIEKILDLTNYPDTFLTDIPMSKLKASQDWLSSEGGGDPVFEELEDYPVVVFYKNEYTIIDGHHRLNYYLRQGIKEPTVYLFDLSQERQ